MNTDNRSLEVTIAQMEDQFPYTIACGICGVDFISESYDEFFLSKHPYPWTDEKTIGFKCPTCRKKLVFVRHGPLLIYQHQEFVTRGLRYKMMTMGPLDMALFYLFNTLWGAVIVGTAIFLIMVGLIEILGF